MDDLRWHRRALQRFVPDSLLGRTPLPTTLILYPASASQSLDKETSQLLAEIPASDQPSRFEVMSDLRLAEPDSSYLFVLLDRRTPARYQLVIRSGSVGFSAEHLRFLLESRVPALPEWFVAGISGLYAANLFPDIDQSVRDGTAAPIGRMVPTFTPEPWLNPEAAEALRVDPGAPRPILPLAELLTPLPPTGSQAYREVWHAQAELFVRWAFAQSTDTRERLQRFAAAAAAGPVDEAAFREAFGLSYADARDALSDYLPQAVRKALSLPLEAISPPPPLELRSATRDEIRRIKGDWARRSLRCVGKVLPEARAAYLERARQLLQRSYDAGDRDPQLLASLALLQFDLARPEDARRLFALHPEIASHRPLAAFAQLQDEATAAMQEPAAANTGERSTRIAGLLERIRALCGRAPPMEAACVLAGRLSQHLGRDPDAAERAFLHEAAGWFPRNPSLAIIAVSWELRAGDNESALRLLALVIPQCADADAREKLAVLQQLATAAQAAPAAPPTSRSKTSADR